ncbi:MAG: esterase-like activity of phytase family protein [Bauldia sp.]
MRIKLTALLLAGVAAVPAIAQEQTEFPAVLAGHAILPADTLTPAPADAPAYLQATGRFQGGPVRNLGEPTPGPEMPLDGQVIQGLSGIKSLGDGTFLVLTDNGFGNKANSPDAMLMFHHVRPDFATGAVEVIETTFLSDPNRVVPFFIANEATETRYLTGWDLDIEGFQPIGDDRVVFGDEFGPYLIAVNRETGIVEAFAETFVGETLVKSPDHYTLQLPNPNGTLPAYNLNRSKGFEGFAASIDGTLLYGLLEGPLWNAETAAYETVEGVEASRIIEFDAVTLETTGRTFLYPFEANGNAIGDFNFIDENRALVIERDNGQGDAALACATGQTAGCFPAPALFKRVYLISFEGVEDGGVVRKIGYIDLLNIQDPNAVARVGAEADGTFQFPFVTIEDVDMVDATHIIVANDNNYPGSVGRTVETYDANEFILLDVADFLAAH